MAIKTKKKAPISKKPVTPKTKKKIKLVKMRSPMSQVVQGTSEGSYTYKLTESFIDEMLYLYYNI